MANAKSLAAAHYRLAPDPESGPCCRTCRHFETEECGWGYDYSWTQRVRHTCNRNTGTPIYGMDERPVRVSEKRLCDLYEPSDELLVRRYDCRHFCSRTEACALRGGAGEELHEPLVLHDDKGRIVIVPAGSVVRRGCECDRERPKECPDFTPVAPEERALLEEAIDAFGVPIHV